MTQDNLTENAIIDGYSLSVPGGHARKIAIGWLLLAVSSLVIGGLFTILIVLSRTPGIQDFFPWIDFFHTALVVHVDLTVLVWFLSFAGLFWSLNSNGRCTNCGWSALYIAAAGTAIMALSPFLGAGGPLMNNYVPVLRDPIFFTGLGVFGVGFTVLIIHGLLFSKPIGSSISGTGVLQFALYTALVIALLSVISIIISYLGMPAAFEGEGYYEILFWGGGHTIQFTHVQLMLMVWLWLGTVSGLKPRISPRVAIFIFTLGAIPALATIYVYYAFEVGSGLHILSFTWLMQYGGGLAAVPIALVIIPGFLKLEDATDDVRAKRSALFFSILLFGIGGIIGFMISGSNVIIPAHYHASIFAVTMAFMGITYHLLPRLGFRMPAGKMLRLQPAIYAVGQMMHVFGLAWSGGHGVQRKTAGSAQGLESIEKIAGMGVMGLGGLIAIIGGVMFLVIVFKAIWPKK
ncbi:MAG: cytochrome c oxidase subunit I [Gammaproteobacteria bacterium]|nr:cytochrome c oxidase subunit I [Gammaproteobacteria bacterium]